MGKLQFKLQLQHLLTFTSTQGGIAQEKEWKKMRLWIIIVH